MFKIHSVYSKIKQNHLLFVTNQTRKFCLGCINIRNREANVLSDRLSACLETLTMARIASREVEATNNCFMSNMILEHIIVDPNML